MNLDQKLEYLKNYLKDLGSVAVAFSGGVDSTLLLKVACDVLGDGTVAITAASPVSPEWEMEEARQLVKAIGARHIVIDSNELLMEDFTRNPKERCYYCKRERFIAIQEIAREQGFAYVADGSNYDDLDDFRPGMRAIHELNVVSPLKEAKMTKEDIRKVSRDLGLPTWEKPSFACLASRIPYGEEITQEKLDMVEKAEDYLMGLGFKQIRVRHHGEIARIEVAPEARHRFFDEKTMDEVSGKLKEIGFTYVALELSGYRTGSLNEVLKKNGEI